MIIGIFNLLLIAEKAMIFIFRLNFGKFEIDREIPEFNLIINFKIFC